MHISLTLWWASPATFTESACADRLRRACFVQRLVGERYIALILLALSTGTFSETYGVLTLRWLPAQGQIPFQASDVRLSTRYDIQQKPVAYFLISLAQKQNQTAESI